jgi:hypothetical protein
MGGVARHAARTPIDLRFDMVLRSLFRGLDEAGRKKFNQVRRFSSFSAAANLLLRAAAVSCSWAAAEIP